MAQKTEKEETEVKVPETLTLCVNNCGLTGNPALNNMCQKCFAATTTSTSNASTTTTTTTPPTTISTTTAVTSTNACVSTSGILKLSGAKSPRSSSFRSLVKDLLRPETSQSDGESSSLDATAKRGVNRCSGCRRKVGLTGFRCRCGELFCSEHRYSDRHDCSYDYKTAGREAIARENPVVKAAKIVKV
ncbi:hypothetical protein K2173_011296 [Erythroxylum novogranatense]|uniref:Zinc finger A20 and AN1 domain-containing stress-associated protein 5 n=1 Tax=Erythroxylum novogranatense TaxID=1862640 RepID=A0AAV8S9K4_9ROSI|nr:hypothetical protein K2173_011296 [Erythroxylum novogranatense]